MNGQKLIKNGQTVLPDRSVLIGQKLVENAKIQMRHFEWFSNNVKMVEFYLNFNVSEKIFQADYPDDIPGRFWNKKPSLLARILAECHTVYGNGWVIFFSWFFNHRTNVATVELRRNFSSENQVKPPKRFFLNGFQCIFSSMNSKYFGMSHCIICPN